MCSLALLLSVILFEIIPLEVDFLEMYLVNAQSVLRTQGPASDGILHYTSICATPPWEKDSQ